MTAARQHEATPVEREALTEMTRLFRDANSYEREDPAVRRCYPVRGTRGVSRIYERSGAPWCSHVLIVGVGDRVQLAWYGDSGVPQYLDQGWATVVGLNPKRVVVQADGQERGYHLVVLPERHVIDVRHNRAEAGT